LNSHSQQLPLQVYRADVQGNTRERRCGFIAADPGTRRALL